MMTPLTLNSTPKVRANPLLCLVNLISKLIADITQNFLLIFAEFCEWPTESRYKDDQGNDVKLDHNGNVCLLKVFFSSLIA